MAEIQDYSAARTCSTCHEGKSLNFFHLKGTDKYGEPRHQSICKDCANDQRVARYQKKKVLKKKEMPKPSSDSLGMTRKLKKCNFSNCEIKIVYHECEGSQNITDIMSDYIEAVYAIPIQGSFIQTKS